MSTNVKSQTKKVTKKKVENMEKVSRISRNGKKSILDDLSFGMSSVEKAVLEQRKAVNDVKYSEDIQKAISSINKLSLTDHEEKLDYAKIKLYAPPYEVMLDNGVEYNLYLARLSDFSIYCTRGNARSMETGSNLSKTSKSFMKSSLTDPAEIIWNSTKFNIVCGDFKKSPDGLYLELFDDIQIRDGGNRAVTIEMLKEYADAKGAGFIQEALYSAIQEFVVRKRGTFPDEKTSVNACINANNSTAHNDVEILRSCGIFDEVIRHCGKYKNIMVSREAEKSEGMALVEKFLEDAGCFDDTSFYTEYNKVYLKSKKGKNEKVGLHLVRTYLNDKRVQRMYNACQNDEFEFDTWFRFLKRQDTVETLINLHLYLENEFLNDLKEKVTRDDNPLEESYLATLTAKNKKDWNKSSRRYLLNSLKVFESLDANGDIYFLYSPIEALKNEEFLRHILDVIYHKTSIGKSEESVKMSSVDGRDTRVADHVYAEAKYYAGKDLKVKIS